MGEKGDDDEVRTKTPDPRVEDDRFRLQLFWEGGFVSRAVDAGARLTVGRSSKCDVVVNHESVSRAHAAFRFPSTEAPILVEDLGSANGTRVNGAVVAPGAPAPLPAGGVVEIGSVMALVHPPLRAATAPRGASDTPMRRVERTAAQIAASPITVLLLGETGVGKGVLAEAIHAKSPRAAKPLLPLNCGALAESLLESELFGHEKGAFTGASEAKAGLLQSADGGTVFLDEVGELPPATQVKLLRVLENREVLPVGGRRPVAVDVRFIAATNRDLEQRVAEGAFRADLFYRLNGISLTVPPLRERTAEIPGLARAFAADAARAVGRAPPPFTDAALAALARHPWPGNVRELRNVVERAVVLSAGLPVGEEHLGLPASAPGSPPRAGAGLRSAIDDFERRRVVEALEQVGGNQSRAAKLLGVSRRTLLRRLDEHGIPRPRKDTGGGDDG